MAVFGGGFGEEFVWWFSMAVLYGGFLVAVFGGENFVWRFLVRRFFMAVFGGGFV